jgi:hypothetical protein
MWTEIGFYEGFALAWKAIYARKNPDDPNDELVQPYKLYFPQSHGGRSQSRYPPHQPPFDPDRQVSPSQSIAERGRPIPRVYRIGHRKTVPTDPITV